MSGVEIDWILLRARAKDATVNSYAPYSKLQVGAAALLSDGTIVSGCNVENASYGLGICAEVTLIGALFNSGWGKAGDNRSIVALACLEQHGTRLAPCGRCRQFLIEHGGPDMLIDGQDGPIALGDLLPQHFGAKDLL